MKIIAAIMDVVFLRLSWNPDQRWDSYRQPVVTKIKRFLVYDPSKVSGWDIERRKDD